MLWICTVVTCCMLFLIILFVLLYIFLTYIHSTTNQWKVLLDIFHMLQKMIAQHFLTEMIIFHQFWWTNSYFFLCPPVWVEHKWLHLQHTGCECCTASVSRAVMGQMTAIVCCNLSWHIDCNLVQFGFTLLILHCTVPLSPVDMCVYWWLCGRRASVQLVLHHVNNIVAFGSVVAGLQNCERCLTRWME